MDLGGGQVSGEGVRGVGAALIPSPVTWQYGAARSVQRGCAPVEGAVREGIDRAGKVGRLAGVG